jgi:hypothetical protein
MHTAKGHASVSQRSWRTHACGDSQKDISEDDAELTECDKVHEAKYRKRLIDALYSSTQCVQCVCQTQKAAKCKMPA